MNIKSTLVERVSKNGKPYVAIEVVVTDKIKKLVFLTPAELELIRITYNQTK